MNFKFPVTVFKAHQLWKHRSGSFLLYFISFFLQRTKVSALNSPIARWKTFHKQESEMAQISVRATAGPQLHNSSLCRNFHRPQNNPTSWAHTVPDSVHCTVGFTQWPKPIIATESYSFWKTAPAGHSTTRKFTQWTQNWGVFSYLLANIWRKQCTLDGRERTLLIFLSKYENIQLLQSVKFK